MYQRCVHQVCCSEKQAEQPLEIATKARIPHSARIFEIIEDPFSIVVALFQHPSSLAH